MATSASQHCFNFRRGRPTAGAFGLDPTIVRGFEVVAIVLMVAEPKLWKFGEYIFKLSPTFTVRQLGLSQFQEPTVILFLAESTWATTR